MFLPEDIVVWDVSWLRTALCRKWFLSLSLKGGLISEIVPISLSYNLLTCWLWPGLCSQWLMTAVVENREAGDLLDTRTEVSKPATLSAGYGNNTHLGTFIIGSLFTYKREIYNEPWGHTLMRSELESINIPDWIFLAKSIFRLFALFVRTECCISNLVN